ncbi:MAG: hypothetical protein ACE37F_22380 [Nannocystaceae bacterium]|nr:hypothetical protein [bacterium]
MRRAKQAAMLLTMAIGLGWSGPATDAQASRSGLELAAASLPSLDEAAPIEVAVNDAAAANGEWRYISARR